jgi:hypothetical protein
MLIARDQIIAGWPADKLRDLMRELRSCAMSAKVLATRLSEDDPEATVARLNESGLVEVHGGIGRYEISEEEDELAATLYTTSLAGNALSKARIGKPMPRARADALLAGLLERIEAENADPDRLFDIESVLVFGSYADPDNDLVGDVDAQVLYHRRYDGDEQVQRNNELLRRREAEGRSTPSTFVHRLFFAETEMQRRLRARQARLDIQFDLAGSPYPLPPGAVTREVYRWGRRGSNPRASD